MRGFPWGSTLANHTPLSTPNHTHAPRFTPHSCMHMYTDAHTRIQMHNIVTFAFTASFQLPLCCIPSSHALPSLSEGGRQFKITPGDLIVVNRLMARIGRHIFLDKARNIKIMIHTSMHVYTQCVHHMCQCVYACTYPSVCTHTHAHVIHIGCVDNWIPLSIPGR